MLTGIDNVLVVAAHADDEVLGCGATMAWLAQRGCAVNVAFIADGVGARATGGAAALAARRAAAERANALLGAKVLEHGDLPDNRLDTIALLDITQRVERLITGCRPQLVLTHHAGDLNVDHRCVHQAVLTACRPQPGRGVLGLLFFEVPSSTEWQAPGSAPAFLPNYFQDVSAVLSRKRAALEAYADELRPWPHARSIEAVEHLARWRGASMGLEAAEAFMVGRWISRA